MNDFLRNSYKYLVWEHGYRLFMRLRGYRLLRKASDSSFPDAFRILVFHDVPESQRQAFDRLVRHLLDVRGILTPEEAEARLEGKAPSGSNGRVPYLLTFDDGFSSNVAVAREILDQLGLKAIFFLCPGLMDISREKHREAIARYLFEGWLSEDKISDDMSFMSWSNAEELLQSGHTIGSHTLHHLKLSNLTEEERHREIVASADRLENTLGTQIKWFAYPFGDVGSIDSSSLRIIADRYRFCCSGLRGLNSTATRPMELLREFVDLASPFEFQDLILNGGMDFRHQKKVRQLAKLVSAGAAPIKTQVIA